MKLSDISEWVRQGGACIGLFGGLAGLYTFLTLQWRRQLRLVVDHSEGNDAHEALHRTTITNKSDLPVAFRSIGPTWFLTTAVGRQRLNFAFDAEDSDPDLTTIAPIYYE